MLLPHVTAYNQPASGTCWTVRRPRSVLPTRLPVCGVSGGEIGNPTSLAELGLDKEVLDEAAEQTVIEVGAANPRPVDQTSRAGAA